VELGVMELVEASILMTGRGTRPSRVMGRSVPIPSRPITNYSARLRAKLSLLYPAIYPTALCH
jgi:hypothetical protein